MPKPTVLKTATTLDLPAGRVLNAAVVAKIHDVIVLGYDVDDNEYFAASSGNVAETLWLVERFKRFLLADDEPEQ